MVASPARSTDPFENLRETFREDSAERLVVMDKLVEQALERAVTLDAALPQLRRDTHTLKGMGDSSGFPLVSMVAHRLENYLDDLDATQGELALIGIRAHIDAMEAAMVGSAGDDGAVATALRSLPTPPPFNPTEIELRNVEALLVTSSRVVGRLVARELAACGIRAALSQSPTEAFTLAIRMKPNLIIVRRRWPSSPARFSPARWQRWRPPTRSRWRCLPASSDGELSRQGLPPASTPFHAGEKLSEDLAVLITTYGIG